MAVSSDGVTIVAGGADGVMRILRRGSEGPALTEIHAHDEINDVCLSPDGRAVASVGEDGRLRWRAVDAPDTVVGEVLSTGGPLFAATFSVDGTSLLYGGADRIVRRADVANRAQVRETYRCAVPDGDTSEIEAIVHAKDAVVVACGGSLAAFDDHDGHLLWSWTHHGSDKQQAVFHALAASHESSTCRLGTRYRNRWGI